MGKVRESLYVTLGFIIVLTVGIIMAMHAAYTYKTATDEIIQDMKGSSKRTIVALQKNVTDLIESYAVNEYVKLARTEMEQQDVFAIVVEDYNMGKILGKAAYVSGQIRDSERNVIDYDPENPEHNKALEKSFFSDTYDVISGSGQKLGTISIYISDDALALELRQIILSTVIDTFAISLLLVMALFITIRLFILQPLSDIVGVIGDRDDDGIPLKPIPDVGPRELMTLSSVMNGMINSIKSSRIALNAQKNILHYQAHHDELTGLANRFLFNDRLERGIEKSKRNETKVAVLFIDLDHFKEINDSLGHKMGDKVLQVVTQRLNDTIRKEDTLARLGGDEFTIMIEGLKEGEDASILANKILKVLAGSITIEEHELYVGSSIGISIYPDNGENAADLLKYADAAMYKAKQEGRNNFQYYSTEMTSQAFERVFMETSLRSALKNDEFLVYYQPQVNGETNEVIGLEALVRWQSSSMGRLVAPDKFIPIAESTGLIIELDRFVMHEGMRQVAAWYKNGLNPGILALNLTIKQLQQKDFIAMIEAMMAETGCRAEWIEFEVTESQIMTHPEKTIKILQRISDMGISIALDDFGTGYSSLSYLKRLPITKLKIDRSFVQDLPHDEEDASITRAVIALAESLKLDLIAEGAETQAQKMFLVQNGCRNIQGYFYAKPMPAEETAAFLVKSL
jgi:diguanylate cyclase (GGDEF)-like protein